MITLEFTFALIIIDLCNRGISLDIASEIVTLMKKRRRIDAKIEILSNCCNGTSSSARKTRAIKTGHCFKCGKLLHVGNCSKNQTNNQYQHVGLFIRGTNRYLLENPHEFKEGTFLHQTSTELLERNRRTLENLSIKDSISDY